MNRHQENSVIQSCFFNREMAGVSEVSKQQPVVLD